MGAFDVSIHSSPGLSSKAQKSVKKITFFGRERKLTHGGSHLALRWAELLMPWQETTMRADGRKAGELRPVKITTGFVSHVPGSLLIEVGDTRVICTATVEDQVPPFLRETSRGWVTAEYGMLPGSGNTRIPREATRGRIDGRTHEIQRLIGRSLRAVTSLDQIGRAHV
jgi:ribonuclease PH